MDATESSSLSSFKVKKPLRFNSKGEEIQSPVFSPEKEKGVRNVSAPSPTPWDVKTPGKATNPPRRTRHRSAAMSIKEVRQAAMMLRERRSTEPSENDLELDTGKDRIVKPKKKSDDSTLPEKYELLDKFFSSLDSSIRLLQLKRSATTFTNISPQIERLTDRRFTHGHLAQLKFIMPDAIVLEKVLRHDESTSCMRPDLRITLNAEAISQNKSKPSSTNLQLRKVFRDRLLEFLKSHPEGDEVPEEELPEPFSQLKKYPNSSSVASSMSQTADVAMPGKTIKASHLSLSFKRSFSQKRSTVHLENTEQDQSSQASLPETGTSAKCSSPIEDNDQIFDEATSVPKSSVNPLLLRPSIKAPLGGTLPSPLPKTPVKPTNHVEEKEQSSAVLKTPVDHASTPVRLMSATPAPRPPKRCCMSPDDNSSRLPNKLARRPANRPLTFGSPVKSMTNADDKFGKTKISTTDDDIYDILPEGLLQSIQEKERLAQVENDPAISQAKWRKQMIASLPKLFDMIYFLFQSIRRSVITKEELIQKIITGHLDVVDRREVEEQVRLLQEFAPEWISEKPALSGDNLICVKKILCPKMIRTRLLDAE